MINIDRFEPSKSVLNIFVGSVDGKIVRQQLSCSQTRFSSKKLNFLKIGTTISCQAFYDGTNY